MDVMIGHDFKPNLFFKEKWAGSLENVANIKDFTTAQTIQ